MSQDLRTARPKTSRAPRTDGPRTTVRVPIGLATSAERLAAELGVSRNDALLRLAQRGAELYEREKRIADVREQRWRAVMAEVGEVDLDQLPSAEEAQEAVLSARGGPS